MTLKNNKQRAFSSACRIEADGANKGRMCFDGAVLFENLEAAVGAGGRRGNVAIVAYAGGPLRVAGYDHPVVIDIAGVSGLGRSIPLLRDHDNKRIVGHVRAENAGGKIVASGQLAGNSADRAEVLELASDGFPWAASVGMRPTEVQFVKSGKDIAVNGQVVKGPLWVATKARLAELTICAVGADADAEVAIAAEDEGTALAAGERRDGQGRGEPAASAGGSHRRPSSFSAEIAEAERVEAIEAAAVRVAKGQSAAKLREIEALLASAVESGLTAAQFELQLMREIERPHNRIATGQQIPARQLEQMVEASMWRSMGTDGATLEAWFPVRVLEAVDDHAEFRHGLSLLDAMQFAAEQHGERRISRRDVRAMLRASMGDINASSGLSTFSLPGILSNVANKALKAAFETVENVWSQISAIGSVSDFKTRTSYALSGDFTYIQLNPGGEIKHGTVGEQSYTNQADTYARMAGLDRRDIINDDLGALNQIMRRLGRGAALKINDVFWTEFMADAGTFYTTGRGNYDEGADTALSIDALGLAELLFLNQTDFDGKPLALSPAILLTANANKTLATNLMASMSLAFGTADSKPVNNPHAGKWKALASSYLSNAAFTGYSAVAWYLLCDPNDLAVIETVFLNGKQQPTIETSEADFNMLGIQMRGYHDFGVNKQEYRAAVKMKGAA